MKVSIVERGTVVSCEGPADEVLALIAALGSKLERITLCIVSGRAAACWSKE